MSDVVVYGFAPSPYVRAVRMTLFEHGVEHDHQPFLPRTPEMQELHPLAKIPVLTHGDLRLFETMAICTYVDETFGNVRLQPPSPAERAVMLQWWSFYNTECAPCLLRPIVVQRLVYPSLGLPVDEDALAAAVPETRRRFEIIDHALAGRDWLVGETVSLADIAIAPAADLASMTPEGAVLLDGLGHLMPWLERVRARDSFQRTAPKG